MYSIAFAMRHPISTCMMVLALIGGGLFALDQLRVDIFPPINQPQNVSIVCGYGGMDPGQMEGLIVNQFELAFQYVDGIREVESRCIQQIAIIKVAFFPGTDMAKAMASIVSEVNRAQAKMPPNVLPPLVIQMDAGSVPVGYLVFESDTRPLGELGDLVDTRVRPLVQKYVPGTIATAAFGTNVRSILVSVDPDRMRAYNLSPDDIVRAIESGNLVALSGNLFVKDAMPLAPTNAMIANVRHFDDIPLKPGSNLYLKDFCTIQDSTDINYGCALVNGRKSVYLPIIKKNTASTLQVVNEIHSTLDVFKNVLPEDVKVSFAFDESPTVRTAVHDVGVESLIGAVLTGLMVLLFLGDWRSMLVVVFSIPMSLLGALLGLWITGATVNIMTLGGMALSIGILVDMSTVLIENIHVQMERTSSIARAVAQGAGETAVPLLLILLCILSVFIPAFIMAEPVRSLFVPLSLSVGFAVITAYVMSSTIVPVLSIWLLKPLASGKKTKQGLFDRFRRRFRGLTEWLIAYRWIVIPGYVIGCAAILGVSALLLGSDLFPATDSGEFVIRFRSAPGTQFEITRQIANHTLEVIKEEAQAKNVDISMGFAGQQSPNSALNNLILFMRGPDDGQLRVKLADSSGIKLADFRDRLRSILPKRVRPWLKELLEREGLSPDRAEERSAALIFGFEPGDIVSEVMSFGSPTPIEIAVISPDLGAAQSFATVIRDKLSKIPQLRDLQFKQSLDYPTVPIEIDRQRAGISGLTAKDVVDSVLIATSSSRYIARNYWCDPQSGVDYQVEVVVPQQRMNSTSEIETIPLGSERGGQNLMVRDVARVTSGSMPGEIDRTTMQRYVSLTANIEGEDLGRAAKQIDNALTQAGKPPKGVRVELRGQIAQMRAMFRSLGMGLAVAVIVILVMLTAYFESFRLAMTSIIAVPGVLCGVAVILLLTGTTLNIESFMGTIMCVGVSVSNSVMLATFKGREWRKGSPAGEAASVAAEERLRPILMTACAMTIGMLPMALALERGSEMQAPLGRAVIGGLIMSTFATLLIAPAFFVLITGDLAAKSASVHPDDPQSKYFDAAQPDGTAAPSPPDHESSAQQADRGQPSSPNE